MLEYVDSLDTSSYGKNKNKYHSRCLYAKIVLPIPNYSSSPLDSSTMSSIPAGG